ncbi:MAG: sulfide/dihydroorotate dehydrogenase-like FAD/NAD-binding protein [Armatimonadota bacterium]|nr:sulfide/dihydroorotate dehydrogenase-like FAD/NAD-binding protein [Armatimonadota bacterium]
MCNKVLRKEKLAETVTLLEIQAPLIAAASRAGQFVVVRPNERAERIPLTISDADKQNGTITVIFQEVGRTTKELGLIDEGDCVPDVAGPLGTPSEIENFGTVACVGGGVGIAFLRPIVAALKDAGNNVITILGARDKSLLILEDEMRRVSDELLITTDNGSYGVKGFVTDALRGILDSGRPVSAVFAIGPMPMMRAISDLTRPYKVKTIVSLDPIMIDGTGMCGGCRVTVGGVTRFTCVDGPDFDAHQVDWDELKNRKLAYYEEERLAMERAAEVAK